MPETPETPNPADPETSGAASAPGSREGQAGGSPPPEDSPTSGGDGQETEREKELRRALTEKGEQLSKATKAAEILAAAMQTPEWRAVEGRLTGKPVEGEEDFDAKIFGEDPGALQTGKAWKARLKEEVRQEILHEMRPVAREVAVTQEERSLSRALKAEGLVPGEAFETFKADFEAENPSYRKLMAVDSSAAAKWLASSYSIHTKRSGRTSPGDRADAILERGGGAPARVGSAASQVKIAHGDPDKILKLHEAITKGETPVDEHGNPYKIKR